MKIECTRGGRRHELGPCCKELEGLRGLVRSANNYLSGGGCGASSVQRAAELWEKMRSAVEDKPKEGK